MAKKDRHLGGTKRFGPRYGKKLKQNYVALEQMARKRHPCPYCHKTKVRRLAPGIWECRKCLSKFTGRAYTPKLKVKEKIVVEETPVEAVEEGETAAEKEATS